MEILALDIKLEKKSIVQKVVSKKSHLQISDETEQPRLSRDGTGMYLFKVFIFHAFAVALATVYGTCALIIKANSHIIRNV